MKKAIIIIVSIASIAVTSCKKEYVCQCSKTHTKSNGTTITESDGLYTYKDTRVRAAERCQQQEGSGSDFSGDYIRDCEIK